MAQGKRWNFSQYKIDKIIALRKQGFTQKSIADWLGCSREAVSKFCAGIEIPVKRGHLTNSFAILSIYNDSVKAEPNFPETDQFELKPFHRRRLEYVRSLKIQKWNMINQESDEELEKQ